MFESKMKRVHPASQARETAVLVSFFGGADYYRRCAERLAAQCEAFDISYDICEYVPRDGEGWTNICRRKIAFYSGKLREYGRAVMWVDIDTQLVSDPTRLLRSNADMGAFLRNFKYLVGFDAMQYARLLHPGYMLFNHTPRAMEFIAAIEEMDRVADPTGTDDFVLQETLASHTGQLSFELFSPTDLVFSNESTRRGEAVFQHGDSGNVKANIAVAAQHDPEVLTAQRQKRVLQLAADENLKAGNLKEALPFLRRIMQLDSNDASATLKLLKTYSSLGWKKKEDELMERAVKKPPLRFKALRFKYEQAAGEADFATADTVADEIRAEGADEDRDSLASREFRVSFDREAARRSIPDDQRVKMWWWERPHPGNLGDMINPYIVEGLTGIPPKFSNASGRVLAIGSIIKFAKKGDKVWGSGAPAADQKIETRAKYHAVRGPLTRQLVLEAGAECAEVYGDPAWFLPVLYPDRKQRKTHRLGLIRHFTHREQKLTLDPDVREIEIIRAGRQGIEAFLDEMLACEAIVSSSLHGVIIANAYGIPARLATFTESSRQIHGDGMKFQDYFLSIGRTNIEALDLSGFERIESALAAQCTDNPAEAIDLKALLDAAPFEAAAGRAKLSGRRMQAA